MTSEDLDFCAAWRIFRISSFLFHWRTAGQKVWTGNVHFSVSYLFILSVLPQFEPEGKLSSDVGWYSRSLSSLISMTAVMKPFALVPAGRGRAPQGSTNVNRTQFPYGDAFTNMRLWETGSLLAPLKWERDDALKPSGGTDRSVLANDVCLK